MTDDTRTSQPFAALPRRRLILGGAGGLTLSLAALTLPGCASVTVPEHRAAASGDDTALLNNALGLEYEAIEAYHAVLAQALLDEVERTAAAAFQGDHGKHAAALEAAIERSSGAPVARPEPGSRFAPEALPGRDDALRFLLSIEQGLALAHLAAVPAFAGRDLAKGAAGILAVESMHWAVWRQALGEPAVPAPILG